MILVIFSINPIITVETLTWTVACSRISLFLCATDLNGYLNKAKSEMFLLLTAVKWCE